MSDDQRIAIRHGFGCLAHTDRPARPYLVFNQYRLAECDGKPLRDQTRDHVRRRTGTMGNNHPQRLVRIGLALRGRTDRADREQ